jgi:hypothetical protein
MKQKTANTVNEKCFHDTKQALCLPFVDISTSFFMAGCKGDFKDNYFTPYFYIINIFTS